MSQLSNQQALDLALQRHRAGRLADAELLYRQILDQQPEQPDALHYLGVVAHQRGQHTVARELILRSLSINPQCALAYGNLGNVLKAQGQLREAILAYRHAIGLNSDGAEIHYSLGVALNANGQAEEAIMAYRKAIAIKPDYFEPYSRLGNALKETGKLDDAIAVYRQACALDARSVEVLYNLGNLCREKGQLDEAIAAYRQALAADPSLPQIHINLGNAMSDSGRFGEAITAFRRAIELKPDDAKAHSNLGNALKGAGQLDEAISEFRWAIALDGSLAEVHTNLGIAMADNGQIDEAIAAHRQATAIAPNLAQAQSNLVLTMHYHHGTEPQAIAAELRRWNRQHAEPLRQFFLPHSNDRAPGRRLRIGYVSPDFRNHVVGWNLLPLFEHHDRVQHEFICYAQVLHPDTTTDKFRQHADTWQNIVGCTDEQVANQIREDRVDILVDLALHTAQSRLLIFARKPAPVQATFAGYPGSTGLSAIDYRLSDPYLDPPGSSPGLPNGRDESAYSEKTMRLPDSFWCYDPLDMRHIAVNPLPAIASGRVTFGCLNNFCKINDDVLVLWAKVLRRVQGSRLLLMASEGSNRTRTLDRLGREGVDAASVAFVHRCPRKDYLLSYHRIDIGLDSFPYNGHTTSLDSIWMGVPVVTLVGERAVSRAGWSQLSNLGLTELAAENPDQFVQNAVALAADLPRLEALRSTLRQRMEQSPLMDAPRFARNIEAAYRQMWRTWCETASVPRQ